MYPHDIPVFFILLVVPVVTLVASLYFRVRRKRFAALISLLLFIYTFPNFTLYTLSRRFDFSYGAISAIFVPLIEVLGVVIGGLLTYRFFSPQILRWLNAEGSPDYSSPAVLQDSVSKILDSEHFLTALRSALPSGREDGRFGLDYIPFILHSIDERRKRALRGARSFLIATVAAALIFSGVVMYFGYILVNEAAAGTPKTLADINASMESAAEALRSLNPTYYNPQFQTDIVPSLTRLEQLEPGPKNKQVREKVGVAIAELRSTGGFDKFRNALTQLQSEMSTDGNQERAYAEALSDATAKMSRFMQAQTAAIPELASRAGELKQLIPKVEESLSKPENRVPEIIKRLALGLVIATFFLALLRYIGNLYRIRYHQVLAAENDDFMIRRFYIAFKSSAASDEQRKAVLSSFMTTPAYANGADPKESSGTSTKQEYEILKELMAALSKKL